MRARLLVVGVALLSLIAVAPPPCLAQNLLEYHLTADLGAAGSAELTARVLVREGPPDRGATILVVPGFAQTAATLQPLGESLFRDEFGHKVSRVILLDLPGHGASGLPTGLPFGFLSVDDYVTAVVETLEALDASGLAPDVLMGHSLGGLIVQLVQERLVSQGSSLRARFGVRGAILLAPVIPAPVSWFFADSGAALPILGAFVRVDLVLGPVVDFPPPAWVAVFYGTRTGVVPAGAPTPDAAVAAGFIALESFVVGVQITGLAGPRPVVSASAFGPGSGTLAGVVTLEQDAFFRFPEHRELYAYLTDDAHEKFFFAVDAADAVHNLHTFDPAPLLHPIKKILNAVGPH
jgi:pimeloyl-ACP methyl ester carboxylesterase